MSKFLHYAHRFNYAHFLISQYSTITSSTQKSKAQLSSTLDPRNRMNFTEAKEIKSNQIRNKGGAVTRYSENPIIVLRRLDSNGTFTFFFI